MKYIYIATLIFFVSCTQTNKNTNKKEGTDEHVKSKETAVVNDNSLADKEVKFLWRDSSSSIVINKAFCQTISDPEKAALGYLATFIGSECVWDGDYTSDRSNLKCEILTALNLGYQCSDTHLGFLRQWFKTDTVALKELESCPTIPNSSTVQETFNEIILTTKGNEISVFFRATAVNLREGISLNWSETDSFQLAGDGIKLIKKSKSNLEKAILETGQ